MKKMTAFQLISFYSPLLSAVFFVCILAQTGCNDAGGQTNQQKSNNWITMNITFKPNTNEEFRDKAIRAIENMWIKSAVPYTQKYPNLYPTIVVTTTPSLDPLNYRLSLVGTFYSKSPSGGYTMLSKTITPPCCTPPVMCPCYCPACDTTMIKSNYSIAKLAFEQTK